MLQIYKKFFSNPKKTNFCAKAQSSLTYLKLQASF